MSASGKKVRAFSQSATQKARMQVSLLSIGSIYCAMIVPTLCVVTPPVTLCVRLFGTQSVPGCIPTQSVGTINALSATPRNNCGSEPAREEVGTSNI
jgi:hypothetical protein